MSEIHLDTGDYYLGPDFTVLSEKTTFSNARAVGSYSRNTYFGTSYWIDPKKEIIAILMLRIYPIENYGIYNSFEDAVY